MTTYRTGTHHGVTIVREGDGARCGRADHDCERGHLVAVVVDGDQALAERICALLNNRERTHLVEDGSGLTTCCGRTPFELSRSDRFTRSRDDVDCEACQ